MNEPKNNKQLINTWIMVSAITALAFIVSGLFMMQSDEFIMLSFMKFSSALALLLYVYALLVRSKRIFKNPALYVISYFVGYVLMLAGLMTTINTFFWGTGLFFMLLPIYFALKRTS